MMHLDPPRASVLIATYNQVDFVRLTLVGLTRQSEPRFEVVLCDDGSGPEIAALADAFRARFAHGLRHVWQEDRGFRKCRALNAGSLASRGAVLVFLDADCIPHRHFVREHLRASRRGSYLVGRRVELGPGLTADLTDEDVARGRLDRLWLTGIAPSLRGRLRHLARGYYVPAFVRSLWPTGRKALLGCNFSCTRPDLLRVNGFDEEFDTPGFGEDSDLERRFRLLGVRPRSIRNGAICYHQHHPRVPYDISLPDAWAETDLDRRVVCARGLREHAAEVASLEPEAALRRA